ncbi:glycogen/starch synthase, partial [Micromonospora globbae]|uniref:glycogen/starch synthase n=1 Tax=Micromonospora globbae TaxID=1894969 RepID=UPI003F4D7B5C
MGVDPRRDDGHRQGCRSARARRQLRGGRMSADADVIDIHPARHQRVLMLSWEYPPVLVGGLGRHVHALSTALAAAGHHVTVV